MRSVLVVALTLVLLAGCSSIECTYAVEWQDPDMVDRLTPRLPEGHIPFDTEGLPRALEGAAVHWVAWEDGTMRLRADHDSMEAQTLQDADPAPVLARARSLLENLTLAAPAAVDDVLERLEASVVTALHAQEPGHPARPAETWYETDLHVAWDVRGFLDARLETIPAEADVLVDGFHLRITPRVATGQDMGLPMTADGFGHVSLELWRSPDDDNSDAALLEAARGLLATEGLDLPADAQVVPVRVWHKC